MARWIWRLVWLQWAARGAVEGEGQEDGGLGHGEPQGHTEGSALDSKSHGRSGLIWQLGDVLS